MAYVAPNEDTVMVCGGLGTMADADEFSGGGATKAVWDANAPGDFIDVNGGTITDDADAAFDYGDKTITAVGIGVGVTVGTLCYLDDGAAEASFFAGRYEVTGVADNVLTFANIELSGIDTDQANGVTVNVGGAIDTIQHVFDFPVNDATLYSRFIYINGIVNDADGTIPVGTAIDIDINKGTTTTMVVAVGYNSTLAAESQVVLEGTADIAAIFSISLADNLRWLIRSLDFNAGGANKANRCVLGTGASADFVTLEDCIFREAADVEAIGISGDFWAVYNSEIYNCGGGFITGGTDGLGSRLIGCSIHDNDGAGIHIEQGGYTIINNLVYDNTGIGIEVTTGSGIVIGNTTYINDGDNIKLPANMSRSAVINNVAVGSTGGYGFNLNGRVSMEHIMFGYNLSAGNNSGHTDISGTFADLGIGSNIASAQAAADLFKNVNDGLEDFTPKDDNSDLYQNALDAGVI